MNEIVLSTKKCRWLANTFDTAVAASLILLGSSGTAFAYIDPGSGSVVITAILGFFGAIVYIFRKAFYKLRGRLFGRAPDDESPQKNPE